MNETRIFPDKKYYSTPIENSKPYLQKKWHLIELIIANRDITIIQDFFTLDSVHISIWEPTTTPTISTWIAEKPAFRYS